MISGNGAGKWKNYCHVPRASLMCNVVRWVHKSSYCEWEWDTGEAGEGMVTQVGCSMDNVTRTGDYDR